MELLRQAIHEAVANRTKECLAFCEEVERVEHEADDQKRMLIDVVLHAGLDAANLLLCYNLAEALESVTDRVANVSDIVKLIMVKSR